MKLRIPRIRALPVLSSLLLVTVAVLWARSPRHADVVAFYTPTGHLTGLASDRGGMLFCASDIPFGREMGLTADAMSTSAGEFAPIHATLFDPSNEKWHFLGFHVAAGTLGQWSWKFSAILVPYWALLIPLAILPTFGFRRLIVRARRKRRGQCLACGYDLRQSPERCPECGRAIEGKQTAGVGGSPPQTPSAARAVFSWIVTGAIVFAAAAAVLRGRHAALAAANQPPEVALVNRPIGSIDMGRVTLPQVVQKLQAASGERIEVGSQMVSVDRNISDGPVPLRDVHAGTALSVAYRACSFDPSVANQVWASPGTLHIGPTAAAPRVWRSYRIGELLKRLQQVPISPRRRWLQAITTDELRQALGTLVVDHVRPDDWPENGGTIGSLYAFADRLWVCQTQEGHAAIRSFLTNLLRASEGSGPSDTEPAEAHVNLEQRIPELNLELCTLEGAIDTVRNVTKANLIVYWNDLEPAGIRRDMPIKLHLWDVTSDRALSAILSVAGGEYHTTHVVQDGIIVIGAPDKLENAAAGVRVYDIRDLVDAFIAFRRPPPTTKPVYGESAFNGIVSVPNEATTAVEAVQKLADLIRENVAKDTWKENGGSLGSLHEFAGRLVITQIPAAHHRIAALLRTLRAGGSKDGMTLLGPEQAAHTRKEGVRN
jgi:hypothetical protein